MSKIHVLFPRLTAGLFALAVLGSTASAQSVTLTPTPIPAASSATVGNAPDSAASVSSAPRRIAPAGFQSATSDSRALTMRQDESMGVGRNVAMMGVGVAGLITGLIIGGSSGTALAIGGGVIGLWGLYKFLQ